MSKNSFYYNLDSQGMLLVNKKSKFYFMVTRILKQVQLLKVELDELRKFCLIQQVEMSNYCKERFIYLTARMRETKCNNCEAKNWIMNEEIRE